MTHTSKMARMSRPCLVLTLLTSWHGANAACNSADSWFTPPGSDIKVFAGYRQEDLVNFANDEYGYYLDAYPVPLPAALLSKEGTGKLSKDDTDTVSYYEANGRGGVRVCRVERWFPPTAGDNDAQRKKWLATTKAYLKDRPFLAHALDGHMVYTATMYFYDTKGRFERVSKGQFDKTDEPPDDVACRRYDTEDRLLISIRPTTTKKCPIDAPDVRDGWTTYKYGRQSGNSTILTKRVHLGGPDGRWFEEWSPFSAGVQIGAPHGHAKVLSKKGVTLIYGSNFGPRDDNSANTVLNSFGQSTGSTYTFTHPPIPVDVLEAPDQLYKYERRRQTYIDSNVKLFELFKPGEHVSRHRYYVFDGMVVRHEQLNAAGEIKRVITVEGYAQPRPGPKPAVDDKRLSLKKLLTHQVFHRVYDIDRTGKPTLVAMSWNRRLRLLPKDEVSIDFADLAYGTPSGKERWKNQEDFERAFDTSHRALHVFPDSKPEFRQSEAEED